MTTGAIELIHEYRTVDKSEWGDGPWQAEPDKCQWVDAATGLSCLAIRGSSGGLCGYVGVERDHPFWRVEYHHDALVPINHHCDEPWCHPSPEHVLEVHGGLTFSGRCQAGDVETSICHIPEPGASEDVWWLGFDTAHLGDYMPGMIDFPSLAVGAIYRDLAYIQRECAALAQQIAGVLKAPEMQKSAGQPEG